MRNLKKYLSIALVISMMSVFLVGCGGGNQDKEKDADSPKKEASGDAQIINLGTSTPGGNYYLIGSGWANLVSTHSDKVDMTSEVTGGSTANLTMMENGEQDIGITLGSSLYEALEGEGDWTQGKKFENLKMLMPLYPSYLTVYSLENKNIKTIHDLTGKRVGTGNLGAGVDSAAKSIFNILGVEPGEYHNDSHSNTVVAAGDNVIDVGISFQNPPYPALMDLEATHKVAYTGLTNEEQEKVVKKLPYLSPGVIPAGAYKGNDEDVNTLQDWNWLVCRADLSEDIVYEIVKTTFDNVEEMLSIHQCTKNMDPENYKYSLTKLHPGVIKYLDEIGVEIEDDLR